MRIALGFVIAAFLAGPVHAAAERPDAGLRPLARPAVEPLHLAAYRPTPRPAVPAPVAKPALRPQARAGVFAEIVVPADSRLAVTREVRRVYYAPGLRPLLRPAHPLAEAGLVLATAVRPATPEAPQPKVRPAGFFEKFRRRNPGAGRYSARGAVCGVNAIKGTQIASFGNPGRGCGVANPVRITSVAGVALSTPATIDCTTAQALNAWVERGIKPAFGRQGGGVAQLKVAAHYACRNRNNRAGGRLSEHARGHAIDISGITLRDGTHVSVLQGWRSKTWGDEMRAVHRSACGPFGTVLGPRADRYHQDHFHVDTARYRSGTYCK